MSIHLMRAWPFIGNGSRLSEQKRVSDSKPVGLKENRFTDFSGTCRLGLVWSCVWNPRRHQQRGLSVQSLPIIIITLRSIDLKNYLRYNIPQKVQTIRERSLKARTFIVNIINGLLVITRDGQPSCTCVCHINKYMYALSLAWPIILKCLTISRYLSSAASPKVV